MLCDCHRKLSSHHQSSRSLWYILIQSWCGGLSPHRRDWDSTQFIARALSWIKISFQNIRTSTDQQQTGLGFEVRKLLKELNTGNSTGLLNSTRTPSQTINRSSASKNGSKSGPEDALYVKKCRGHKEEGSSLKPNKMLLKALKTQPNYSQRGNTWSIHKNQNKQTGKQLFFSPRAVVPLSTSHTL